jgi:hypothetical protein
MGYPIRATWYARWAAPLSVPEGRCSELCLRRSISHCRAGFRPFGDWLSGQPDFPNHNPWESLPYLLWSVLVPQSLNAENGIEHIERCAIEIWICIMYSTGINAPADLHNSAQAWERKSSMRSRLCKALCWVWIWFLCIAESAEWEIPSRALDLILSENNWKETSWTKPRRWRFIPCKGRAMLWHRKEACEQPIRQLIFEWTRLIILIYSVQAVWLLAQPLEASLIL